MRTSMRFSGRSSRTSLFVAVLSFALLPGSALAQQARHARQSRLADLDSQLRVGAEFFLNRDATRQSVEQSFRQMRANGLTLARIFILWDDIERSPGHWDFTHYDWIYDAAERNGIKIAATLCSEDPPGWKRRTPFYHHYTNLDIPANRADAAEYIDRVVNHYKDNPAQGVWLLMNEPNKYDTDPATFHAFGRWLEKKYGNVDELNRHWFRPLHAFSGAAITSAQLSDYWTDPAAYLDWKQFNVDHLIEELRWIKARVLSLDPNHPTHFNVTDPTGDARGQDVWKEKAVPDAIGASMHAAWTFPLDAPESEFGERYAYRLDLIAGASRNEPAEPFWVTELQSGPTVFTGRYPLTVTPQMLSRWMWDSYGAGARSVIFWLWQPRDIGTEGGEWGLVGLDGQPTVRLNAVDAVAQALASTPGLASAHPQQARVAILFNREASLVNDFEGRIQHRQQEVEEALYGCYLALSRAHLPVQFIDLDQLKRGDANKFAVLYAPDSYAIDEQAITALDRYVRQGGILWADGLTGWQTETTHVRATVPGGNLREVFGVEASDIYPVREDQPYSVTAENERGGELWRLPLSLQGAKVVLRDQDGNPFATVHTYGRGRAYYFESGVSLAYARRGNPLVAQWIVNPALAQLDQTPVYLEGAAPGILFRGLTGTSERVAILSNWGKTQTVKIHFAGIHKVTDVLVGSTASTVAANGQTIVTITVESGSSAVLVAE